jgi:hypothetical protein
MCGLKSSHVRPLCSNKPSRQWRLASRLREGIVNYEKIRRLREQAAGSELEINKQLLLELDPHLGLCVAEHAIGCRELRR